MKRFVLFSIFVLTMSFSVFAGKPMPGKVERICTVTATVKVMGSSVTISSTKATCEEAAADVREGIRRLLNKK